jgi:hypothetical protein
MNFRSREGKTIEYGLLGKKYVEFTSHAIDRMKQRAVSETEVLSAIESPDGNLPSTNRARRRVRKFRQSGGAYDVVYELRQDRIGIITVINVDPKLLSPPSMRRRNSQQRKKR